MKPILDVCCGGRMFYADKENPNVLFCDKRFFETTFKKVGKDEKFSVKPDRIVDFRDLPFKNESFYLVIFDPPHILRGSQKSFDFHQKTSPNSFPFYFFLTFLAIKSLHIFQSSL